MWIKGKNLSFVLCLVRLNLPIYCACIFVLRPDLLPCCESKTRSISLEELIQWFPLIHLFHFEDRSKCVSFLWRLFECWKRFLEISGYSWLLVGWFTLEFSNWMCNSLFYLTLNRGNDANFWFLWFACSTTHVKFNFIIKDFILMR